MTDDPKNFELEKWKKTMTNYQFNYILELKDKVTSYEQKIDSIFQLLKEYTDGGKSSEETLAAIEQLKN
jgi:hypothetical protein